MRLYGDRNHILQSRFVLAQRNCVGVPEKDRGKVTKATDVIDRQERI